MQPVAQQASSAERGWKLAQRQLPCGLQEAKGVLHTREGMLNTYAGRRESLVEELASPHLCRRTCCSNGELRILVRADASAILRVGDISEDVQGGTQPRTAQREGDGFGCACGWIPSIDDSKTTWDKQTDRVMSARSCSISAVAALLTLTVDDDNKEHGMALLVRGVHATLEHVNLRALHFHVGSVRNAEAVGEQSISLRVSNPCILLRESPAVECIR